MPTEKPTIVPDQLISLTTAAARCDVSVRSIQRWISAGRLAAYRVGPRLVRIDAAELATILHRLGGAV